MAEPEPANIISQSVASRTKDVLPSQDAALQNYARLSAIFPERAFVPVPAGKKEPILAGWRDISLEQLQSEAHKQMILYAFEGANVGIMLGERYGRLLTVNIHDGEAIKELERQHPWLLDTTRSWACRGCQFWAKLDESCDYPKVETAPSKYKGRVIGEIRFRGQSIIHGRHKAGMNYEDNGKPPKEVDLSDLYELHDEFAAIFPQNRHVEEKLRQQLQVLRDAGEIVFLDYEGNYERVRR